MCERCQVLERELDRARRDLQEAQDKIDLLERVLERIARLCLKLQDRARPILSRRSGVPLGLWSRIKGRVDVANLVLRLLGG